ncbi:ribosomal protein S6 kinase-like 1 [Salvelinus namaycush]|uniref:Ribosomal protein S6 kinase-like 1 n=1 Tax=Salvelinus namaycush TaxID=8040 RepID=A0A8U1EVV9_SALNM|nr:ribosomal protein S6 kinase-like 1 [Salvelinus namaycush]
MLVNKDFNLQVEEDNPPVSRLTAASPSGPPQGRARTAMAKRDYLVEAAKQIRMALDREVSEDYEAAFSYYKNGVDLLLNGVQVDPNKERREAVKRKTTQYLKRAEEIFISHLQDNLGKGNSHLGGYSSLRFRPIRHLSSPVEDLEMCKVVGIIDKVLIVQSLITKEKFVVKSLPKSSWESRDQPTIIPQGVPFMVKLLRYYVSEDAVYLHLEHVQGGKLFSKLHKVRNDRAKEHPECSSPSQHRIKMKNSYTSPTISSDYQQNDRKGTEKTSLLETENEESPDTDSPAFWLEAQHRLESCRTHSYCEETGCLQNNSRSAAPHTPATQLSLSSTGTQLGIQPGTSLALTGVKYQVGPPGREPVEEGWELLSPVSKDLPREKGSLCYPNTPDPTGASPQCRKGDMDAFLKSEESDGQDEDQIIEVDGWCHLPKFPAKASRGRDRARQSSWGLPEPDVRLLGAQILLALESLHQQGVVCRDLNPKNILLTSNGKVCLTFFGQWSEVQSEINSKAMDQMYCAPEIGGVSKITEACDWWSLGALLIELLTGMPLWQFHPAGVHSHTQLLIPDHLSTAAASLLTELLQFDAGYRLGSGGGGVSDIKCHPFFNGVSWKALSS